MYDCIYALNITEQFKFFFRYLDALGIAQTQMITIHDK